MKQLFSGFFQKIRQLFDFHQPGFLQLDFVDLVLENKLLLLISWDIAHAAKICIRPGRVVYRKSSGAALCTLPLWADSVEISIHNVWRSARTSFPLKRVAIDRQTLQYLDKHFPTLELVVYTSYMQPGISVSDIELKRTQPELSLQPIVSVFSISINQSQLYDYVP